MYRETPLCFEWDKFIQTLEKYLPNVLDEMLNHKATTSFRHNHTNVGRIQRQPSPRFPQLRNTGQAHNHSSFCHIMPEVSQSHHHNIEKHKPYLSWMPHIPVYTWHFCRWIQQSLPPSWQKNSTARAPKITFLAVINSNNIIMLYYGLKWPRNSIHWTSKACNQWDQPFSFCDGRTTCYSSSNVLCRNIQWH